MNTPRTNRFYASFADGECIPNQDEWLALCESLERELTAAREELKETKKHLKDANRGAEINAHALRINADKLTTAREELADWRILNGWGGTPEIINDFIKGQQTRIHHAQNIEEELTTVTEQRDRLAEAMQTIIRIYENADKGCIPSSSDMYDEALQSLNEPTKP